MVIGSDNKASVSEADNSECPKFRSATNKPRPKRPYTMLGTPERFLMASRIVLTSRPLEAYSLR
jgi:hypothetical protein